MFSPFERLVAWRYLRSKKAEGFVSVIAGFSFLGILLGVATLIIVMSVMNGFRQELFSRILGLNGHMNVYALQGPLHDYDYLRSKIVTIPGVKEVVPIIEEQALISKSGKATGVMARGLSKENFSSRDILANSVVDGSLDNFEGNRVAIGKVLADSLHLAPGDPIVLTSPQVKSTPFGSMPRQRSYEVAFIFDVDMYEYNANFIFMPLDTAQIFFNSKGAVKSLEVFLENPDKLDEMRQAVSVSVEGRAGVYDWRDTHKSFYETLIIERNVMFIILTLIILIAAFNIISSMIMLVKDKAHDIAIMRTMGATQTNMMKIFMLTGSSIGVIGTFFGTVIGILFALNIDTIRHVLEKMTGWHVWVEEIRWLSQIPAEIDWTEVGTVIFVALFLTVIFTLYPAWRASRLDPVEALRYE